MNSFISYAGSLFFLHLLGFLYIWYKRRDYLTHFSIFCVVEIFYFASNYPKVLNASVYNHYVYMADALLHGRPFLDFTPQNVHDYAYFQGKYHIANPPLPGFLMVPFVMLYGKGFNDTLFTILMGAFNCVIVFNLLLNINNYSKKNMVSQKIALLITIFFAFGTVHWYVTARGTVWHTAQIAALFFLLLAVNEALGKRRYLLIGIFASIAILARPSVFCAFPFFIILAIKDYLLQNQFKIFFKNMAFFIIPYIFVGVLLGLWNFFQFGNPMDFGFEYVSHAPHLRGNLDHFGKINFHYFPINIKIVLLQFFIKINVFPYYVPPPEGMAILFVSPLLIYCLFNFSENIFFAIPIKSLKGLFIDQGKKYFEKEYIPIGALLSVIFTAVPLLLYFNTGWVQFGYRYLLDYIPFLLILLAYGLNGKFTSFSKILLVLSILLNLYGTIIFIHYHGLMWAGPQN